MSQSPEAQNPTFRVASVATPHDRELMLDLLEERAAIREYDGGQTRAEAEAEALGDAARSNSADPETLRRNWIEAVTGYKYFLKRGLREGRLKLCRRCRGSVFAGPPAFQGVDLHAFQRVIRADKQQVSLPKYQCTHSAIDSMRRKDRFDRKADGHRQRCFEPTSTNA
ncbi:MAG: hypothetical protein KJN60_00590 [Boseongicola sp.]|nr:hypothetical protein [Boseongicola sp.]